MTERDQEEQDWKITQMQTDVDNKQADTALKIEQLRWEPWKALSAAFGAGIATASALIAVVAWAITHWPTPPK